MRSLTGWKKDKPDDRALLLKDLLAALPPIKLPDSFRCVPNPPIMNQGQTSACVAYSHTLVRKIEKMLEGKPVPNFDPDALYNQCKKEDGIPNEQGTYPTTCCDIMLHEGMPVKAPGFCWFHKAAANFDPSFKIGAYWKLTPDLTVDQIKTAIYMFGPITSANNWDNAWMNMMGKSVFPDPSGQSDGGHDVCQQGYSALGIEYDNSWGTIEWGVGGIATMPWDMYRSLILKNGDVMKIQDSVTANKAFRRLLVMNRINRIK